MTRRRRRRPPGETRRRSEPAQAFPSTVRTRKIFENDALEGGAWVRLKDEATRSTLTLKQVTDSTTNDCTTEI
ncbi:hypothetical protein SMICM304S_05065 [Streptomyces microflavus]